MKLTIPPEPTILKDQAKGAAEKKWDIDTLSMWFGNRLPSYLWKEGGWSIPLKIEGYTWQSFLKILSLHKKEIIRWSRNALSWGEFLSKVQETIKDPVIKKLILG